MQSKSVEQTVVSVFIIGKPIIKDVRYGSLWGFTLHFLIGCFQP